MQMQQSYEAPTTTTSAAQAPGYGNPTNSVSPPPLSMQSGALSSMLLSQPTAAVSSAPARNPPVTSYQSVRQPSSTPSSTAQNALYPSAPISTNASGSLHLNGSSGLPQMFQRPLEASELGPAWARLFSGFQQRTGQANQACLAAAAHNLPRRSTLPN